jgi:peptide/nickel transport system ATP-binding protein
VFVLDVENLTVRYGASDDRRARSRAVVDSVSFALGPGEILGVSGPSGCGKSTLALALLGLLPGDASVSGTIRLGARDLGRCAGRDLVGVRGGQIGIIFQESGLVLNPLRTVGAQIADVVRAHDRCNRATARSRALAAMDDVGLGDERQRLFESYPHELSGGQRQRVLIAQAVVSRPSVVIADEPTASLDADVRAGVLDLIRELSARHRMAFMLITHSADVLASTARRIIEMQEGRVVAEHAGDWSPVPRSTPSIAVAPSRSGAALLEITGGTKLHSQRRLLATRHQVEALRGVDLRLHRGRTLGLTGPSGCGKSTLAKCLAGLDTLDSGEIAIDGRPIAAFPARERQQYRNQVQLIFQDTAAALNPRFTALDVITEPMVVQSIGTPGERRLRAVALMRHVGLPAEWLDVRASDLSGGERQRLAIARALATKPRVVILDEAFSGLDVRNRRRIIGMLQALQASEGLTYLCISHDRAVLAEFASEIAVMRDGRIVDQAVDVPSMARVPA